MIKTKNLFNNGINVFTVVSFFKGYKMIQENFLNEHKVNTNCPWTLSTYITITITATGFTSIPRTVFEKIQSYN